MQDDLAFRLGVIIPTYRHTKKLANIVETIRLHKLPCIIVDDGNTDETRDQIVNVCNSASATTYVRRDINGGKGAALKLGFSKANELNWTHAIQIDADGQHDLDAVSRMIELSENHPNQVICGVPVYDDTIPKSRKIGREITHFWVRLETMGNEIKDSMCGLRVYPIEETNYIFENEYIGARMDFDTEVLVHLNWRGVRTIDLPVKVTYPENNISNFRVLRDNVRISLMHTRLFIQSPLRVPIRALRRKFMKHYNEFPYPKP